MDVLTAERLIGAFGVVLVGLCAFAALARFLGLVGAPGRGGRLVTLLETTALSNEAALHVVRVVDQYYVIARASGSVSLLCPLAGERVEAVMHETASSRNRTGVRFLGWKPEARDGADAVRTE